MQVGSLSTYVCISYALDYDINPLNKFGGQLEVNPVSVQFVFQEDCLRPYFLSLPVVTWAFLQDVFCSHRCGTTWTRVVVSHPKFVKHVVL